MRTCRQNPLLSAHTALHGEFHFDATPMAPPGTETLAQVKPGIREAWGFHSMEAWYVGPAPMHYRCYTVIAKKSGAEHITDTVKFKHHAVALPTVSYAERVTKATNSLIHAIKDMPQPSHPPHIEAIEKLRAILKERLQNDAPDGVHKSTSEGGKAMPHGRRQHEINQEKIQPHLPVSPHPHPRNKIPCITQEEDEEIPENETIESVAPQHRYDLRSRAKLIVNSVIIDEPPNVTNFSMPRKLGAPPACPGTPTCAFEEPCLPPYFANTILDPDSGKELEYRHLIKMDKYKEVWSASFARELYQLAQGNETIKGTDTIFFIPRSKVPPGRKVTYGRIVVDYRPQKDDPNRTRLTVGGDRLEYPWNKSTPTAGLTTSKLLFNSILSTAGAKFLGIDIRHFYLCTPLDRYEYMRLPLNIIPEEVVARYKLRTIAHEGWIYIEIQKGMYGLPQAGILAHKLLVKRLAKFGYYPVEVTPGLWRHKWRPVTFSLVVDDFGVKYVGKEHAQHLIAALQTHYNIAIDWEGRTFCGITLNWNYKERTVDLSMPGYIERTLKKFQHKKPDQPVDAPHQHIPIIYGKNVQTVPEDTSPKLSPPEIKRVQNIVGTLLYYARAVDCTLAAALSTISSKQAHGTEATRKACHQLLDYVATHPNATVRFLASDMILTVHSDASYLSEANARSRAGGHFFLSKMGDETFHNGAILTLSSIIKHVLASASEAELAAMFYNTREAIPLRVTLEEMGHPQPKTPIVVDNSTAHGLTDGTMVPKRSKAMDMRFHWLRCREAQDQVRFLWRKGSVNRADYHTKHHPASHHRLKRSEYLAQQVTHHNTLYKGLTRVVKILRTLS